MASRVLMLCKHLMRYCLCTNGEVSQTFQTAQTTAEAAQVAFDSSSRASSRPRYSELRKARASALRLKFLPASLKRCPHLRVLKAEAVLAGQSAEAVEATTFQFVEVWRGWAAEQASCASSVSNTGRIPGTTALTVPILISLPITSNAAVYLATTTLVDPSVHIIASAVVVVVVVVLVLVDVLLLLRSLVLFRFRVLRFLLVFFFF